jgi:hypothetical protein
VGDGIGADRHRPSADPHAGSTRGQLVSRVGSGRVAAACIG